MDKQSAFENELVELGRSLAQARGMGLWMWLNGRGMTFVPNAVTPGVLAVRWVGGLENTFQLAHDGRWLPMDECWKIEASLEDLGWLQVA